MKLVRSFPAVAAIFVLGLALVYVACRKQPLATPLAQHASDSSMVNRIYSMGYDTNGIIRVKEGYIVDRDFLLTDSFVRAKAATLRLVVAKSEQYQTTFLITGLPRVITVSAENFPLPVYVQALDIAVARYNALGMRLTFQRVAANGVIRFVVNNNLPANVWAVSGGFPTSGGQPPANPISLHTDALGPNPDVDFLASTMAHEMGHDIGFRHTDYFNRAYSGCQVDANDPANEGDAGVGAIHIPGTPTGGDPNSWMLACNGGVDRPFNANDVIALNYLYGEFSNVYHSKTDLKQGCPPGQVGSQVTYVVPAGTYRSMISQADADNTAQNDINANAQNYANAHGTCAPADLVVSVEFVISSDEPSLCPDGNTYVNNNYYSFTALDASGHPVNASTDITITCNAIVNGFNYPGYTFTINAGSSTSDTFTAYANCNGSQDNVYGPMTASDANFTNIPIH